MLEEVREPARESKEKSERRGASKSGSATKISVPTKKSVNLRQELVLVFSLALALFLFFAFWSFHPQDPAWSHQLSIEKGATQEGVHNLGGKVGAYIADLALKAAGYAAYLIPLLLAYGALHVTLRWRRGLAVRLFAGAALLFLTTSLLASRLGKGRMLQESFYAGGWIGNLLGDFFQGAFGGVGLWLLMVSLLVGAFALLLEFSLTNYVAFARKIALLSATSGQFIWQRRGMVWQKLALATFWQKLRRRYDRPKIADAFANAPKVYIPPVPALEATKPVVPVPLRIVKPPVANQPTVENDNDNEPPPSKRFEKIVFKTPSMDLLPPVVKEGTELNKAQLIENARLVEKKLADFGVQGKVTEIQPGPVITLYEYAPASGIKVNKISQLADDLALALSALSVRIVAPIPGKAVVGIEISNPKRETVYFAEICSGAQYRSSESPLALALGKDIAGNPVVADLQKMPHLLIAGATGSGKSVAVNTMILSILYRAVPQQVRFLMIDPKMLELSLYDEIPHLIHPVITDPRKAARALKWVVAEMERRYGLMADLGVRNLENYNKRLQAGERNEDHPEDLPYIVVVIDELADLMIVNGRDIEESLTRLAQMARASGIHLLLATQRPSVDVLTGIIKANFPGRISFKVSSKTDSRTILDMNGAEKLLGNGDMLFMPPGTSHIQRIHGGYIAEADIKQVTDFLRDQGRPEYIEIRDDDPEEGTFLDENFDDEMYTQAVEIVRQANKASISLVQRRLRIGYNRAARMIERMEMDGIVSRAEGGKPRTVIGRME